MMVLCLQEDIRNIRRSANFNCHYACVIFLYLNLRTSKEMVLQSIEAQLELKNVQKENLLRGNISLLHYK